MLRKQTVLLTLTTLLTTGAMAQAETPTSQFGYQGWPYRNEVSCPNGSASNDCSNGDCATLTTGENGCVSGGGASCTLPSSCTTATPYVTTKPTLSPTKAPESTALAPEFDSDLDIPAISPVASPTKAPAASVKPTDAVCSTNAPQATATMKPTSAPTAEATASPTQTPSMDDDYTTGSVGVQEQNAANLVNSDRNANGLSALALDPALCDIARRKSEDMRDNNYFAHTSPTYGSAGDMLKQFGYSFSAVGENIAHHATVIKAQAAFMSSDGHRRNILSSSWTKMGIGVCYDSQGFVYVTQLFVR